MGRSRRSALITIVFAVSSVLALGARTALRSELSPSPALASAPADATGLPPYTVNVREFVAHVVTTFKSSDRYDKQPFSGKIVLLKQPTPPGFVGAHHPTIANDEMQRVTEQRFSVDGKDLKYVENPRKGQVDFWTLGKEADTGWDTNIIVIRPAAGTPSIKLDAIYKGFVGNTAYIPGERSGKKLSNQERKEFLRLDESICTTTKAEMDSALSSVSILRKQGEKPIEYVVRLARWCVKGCPPQEDHIDNNIPEAIRNQVPGNCNQISDVQAFSLRSQGIPAVIESGLVGDERVAHVGCSFFDEVTGRWYRMPQGTSKNRPEEIFGPEGDSNFLIFQRDTTFQMDSDIRALGDTGEDTGGTVQTGSGTWNFFDGGKCQGGVIGVNGTGSWSKLIGGGARGK